MPILPTDAAPRAAWLPSPGSWQYHLLLGAAGMLVLGPLGGVAAAYMNFSLGFFVGGQVLAGILGSVVTAGYGASGRHGANYIQTAAASVAGMGGMAVVLQAMAWLGMAQPPLWQLVLYLLCIGMFGVGVGMLYTPLLVDRMQLTFPSGLAVANILRALTDPTLLRRSVARLGGGMALGLASGLGAGRVPWLAALDLSAATFGAGMIVGARVGVAALVGGLAGWAMTPWFVDAGWLAPGEPYRKATFLVALGMIMGAAVVDLAQLLAQAWRRWRGRRQPHANAPRRGPAMGWVAAWALLWAVATVAAGVMWFGQPLAFQLIAVLLALVFALVNGISVGMVDQNPISSAFVLSVILMAAAGLRAPQVGLIAATVLLVATAEASDMQQDRSTGWRLGSDRMVQFGYQVAGIVVGALVAVAMARLFLQAYPVLALDQTSLPAEQQPARWTSAMTYKIVGVLHGLSQDRAGQYLAVAAGLVIGLATALLRRAILGHPAWQRFARSGRRGQAADFMLDAVLLPSPYASSFGGFVNLAAAAWMAAGGVLASLGAVAGARGARRQGLPRDMNTASLLGGGLIAGDALAALGIGMTGLLSVT
ncbi:OPT/YSL family transporter [Cupriavidus taiwanensis]|uniref:Putative oligopeptide transporter OPT superfamily n=1 Tax=Cupriavidus taiwanensis TaxID=164546 RepID=A0A375INV5_9BURK|nr:OPT/YSL family transporter [Cupriavidus taiwanensis]SOY59585.1 Putative oligopeptide transporter; OPT superfamily [Cupriavidus taiwanensis]SOY59979.1 Putative oligopeptide transporter; OPT superfamily [Cupriavidus taiwanensis]SOY92064.1 Putative oligopeptide transporter; OPT superfamily [Cupriavidus taiwanensis]SOZ26875.1 Putative oligopeptide transporter; OPT superfamily [Cupriavidus taiwanensis]SOZ65883.1 Putative oligopeptide transporter; OPT superfamily [Cupriavidus taiwanensis]